MVKGVKNYQNLLFHYGGMSGKDFKDAVGMDVDLNQVIQWFNERSIEVIDHITNDHAIDTSKSKANRLYRKIKKDN